MFIYFFTMILTFLHTTVKWFKTNLKSSSLFGNNCFPSKKFFGLFSSRWLLFYNAMLIIIYLTCNCKDTVTLEELDNGDRDMKYVLQWTNPNNTPFHFLEESNEAFLRNKCEYTNCYVTKDRTYFFSVKEFDAIIFNGLDVSRLRASSLPRARSPKQKYIFGAMESADRYPVCDPHFDRFFNWTWTYRLDSDFRWGYLAIYDLKGDVVGPDTVVEWAREMDPPDEQLKLTLSRKSKAAAWFVSHCRTKSRREQFVRRVRKELLKFRLTVDIFGKCGVHDCSKSLHSKCSKMIQDNYFFYFAFENSFAQDYVTEKLLTALNNYAVPVVYGGANYSRFVPKEAYLDGLKLGAKRLALKMSQIIQNKTAYYEFFRWKNHYVYESRGRNDVCKLCAMLNNQEQMSELTEWYDFRSWWNEKNRC